MNRALLAAFLLGPSPAASAANLVDIANDVTDPNNTEDDEPSIAVDPSNPRNISVVAFSGDRAAWIENDPNHPEKSNAIVWRSTDGGATWTNLKIIPPPIMRDTTRSGPNDQKIAYDSSGNLFVAEMATNINGQNELYIYRTDPASAPNLAPGARYGLGQHGDGQPDQPQLDIDKVSGSPCFGTLYSPYVNLNAQPHHHSNVAWSSDQGRTMTDVMVGDNTAFDNRATRIVLARDGKAYVVYKQGHGLKPGTAPGLEDATFVVQRSDDCGKSWNALSSSPVKVHPAATVVTFFADPATGNGWGAGTNLARAAASDAWIAVDPSSGDVYVAHVSVDDSSFGQIYVARSTDNGKTWAETRVTDGTSHSAYPEIAVADNGTIGVLYIDYIVPPGWIDALFRQRFMQSFDRGLHWTEQMLYLDVLNPSQLCVGHSENLVLPPWDSILWGDYEGLTASGNTFYGVFTSASIGRKQPAPGHQPGQCPRCQSAGQCQPDPIFFTEQAATMPAALIISILDE